MPIAHVASVIFCGRVGGISRFCQRGPPALALVGRLLRCRTIFVARQSLDLRRVLVADGRADWVCRLTGADRSFVGGGAIFIARIARYAGPRIIRTGGRDIRFIRLCRDRDSQSCQPYGDQANYPHHFITSAKLDVALTHLPNRSMPTIGRAVGFLAFANLTSSSGSWRRGPNEK